MTGLRSLGACAAVAVAMSVTAARAATYSAAGNTLPTSPFQRFDAAHIGSTFPLSPYFGQGFSPTPDHSVAGGVYSSGLSDSSKYTFWFDPSQTLNATTGIVEISTRLKVVSSTSTTDRAGVSMAMTDDDNNYTEIYLGTGEVFINGAGRLRSAAYTMNTTDDFHDYLVRVQGDDVSVYVDGVLRLSANSFDASTVSAPTLANWAVLGDITSSAAGAYEMQSFAVAVPEPTGVALVAVAGMAVAPRRRRRR